MATKTTKPVIVRVPSVSPATRRRVAGVARRAGGAAARAAYAEKHTIAAVLAAAAFGWMKKSGVQLPKIDAIGTPGTYGLVAWGLGRFMGSPVASHIATGLMSVSAYELASGQTLSGGEVMGDDAGSL